MDLRADNTIEVTYSEFKYTVLNQYLKNKLKYVTYDNTIRAWADIGGYVAYTDIPVSTDSNSDCIDFMTYLVCNCGKGTIAHKWNDNEYTETVTTENFRDVPVSNGYLKSLESVKSTDGLVTYYDNDVDVAYPPVYDFSSSTGKKFTIVLPNSSYSPTYTTGTITSIMGGRDIIGNSTSWLSAGINEGDKFKLDADPESSWSIIDSVDTDTKIILKEDYSGGNSGAYAVTKCVLPAQVVSKYKTFIPNYSKEGTDLENKIYVYYDKFMSPLNTMEALIPPDNSYSNGTVSITLTGTNTGTDTNKLIDSGATYTTKDVLVGDKVLNLTDETEALVTAVDSETQLTLSADIFQSSSKSYKIISRTLWGTSTLFTKCGLKYGDRFKFDSDGNDDWILIDEVISETKIRLHSVYEGDAHSGNYTIQRVYVYKCKAGIRSDGLGSENKISWGSYGVTFTTNCFEDEGVPSEILDTDPNDETILDIHVSNCGADISFHLCIYPGQSLRLKLKNHDFIGIISEIYGFLKISRMA